MVRLNGLDQRKSGRQLVMDGVDDDLGVGLRRESDAPPRSVHGAASRDFR
jgi:hypothetical protein